MSTATASPPPLTERQRLVLTLIYESVRDRGFQPSYREIGKATGIGTPNGVREHLALIARKGYIAPLHVGQPGAHGRSVRILRTPAGRPFRGFAEKPPG